MSDAPSIPGIALAERLCARGMRRLNIGPSPVFYERFGLEDPWNHLSGSTEVGSDNEMFSFLSSAPYYARLRAQQSAAARARRRLLDRMAKQEETAHASRARRRLTGLVGAGKGTSAAGSWMRMSQSALFDGDLVTLESGAPEVEEEEQAPERRTYTSTRRPRTQVARKAPQRAVAAAAPMLDTRVLRALERLGLSTKGEATEIIERVIQAVSAVPERDQVATTRRIVRKVRGTMGRMARMVVDEAAQETVVESARHTDVARSRTAAVGGTARKSRALRPVLSSSPAMTALQFEEPEAQTEEAPRPRRRRAPVAPAQRTTAHRDLPVADVARDVRTQRVSGRAGPAVAVRTERTPAPALPQTPATARVARLAVENSRSQTSSSDVRRGMAATGMTDAAPVQARTARVAARSLAARPGASTAARVSLASAPLSYVDVQTDDGVVAPVRDVRRRRRALEVRTGDVRRAPVASSDVHYVQPDAPDAPVDASAPAPRRATTRTERAASVTHRTPRRTAAAATAAQVLPTERLAARLTAAVEPRRRSLITATPTAYVEPFFSEASEDDAAPAPRRARAARAAATAPVVQAGTGEPVAAAADASPARRAARRLDAPAMASDAPQVPLRSAAASSFTTPSVRAFARAAQAERVDSRGSELVTPDVTAHVRNNPVRRSQLYAPAMQAIAPELPEAPEADVAPARRRAPAAARPSVRAASRSVDVPRVDDRGRVQLTSSPVSYVADRAMAAPSSTTDDAPALAPRRTVRSRVAAPSAVVLQPEVAQEAEAVAAPRRRSSTARVAERAQAAAPRAWESPSAAPVVDVTPAAHRAEERTEAGRSARTRRIAAAAPGATLVQPDVTDAIEASPTYRTPRRAAPAVRNSAGQVVRARGAVASTAANAVARFAAPAAEAPRQQRVARRPMSHIGTDFRWLASDAAPEVVEAAPAPRRRASRGIDMGAVLREVNAAVRAAERSERPAAVGRSIRRAFGDDVPQGIVRAARNIASVGAQVLVTRDGEIELEETPSAWAESRAAASATHSRAPNVRTIRRVLPAPTEVLQSPIARASERSERATPARRRPSVARTQQESGRFVARSARPVASATTVRTPVAERVELAAEPTMRRMATFGLGSPVLPVGFEEPMPEVDEATGALRRRPSARAAAAEPGQRAVRPLDATLDYVGQPETRAARRQAVAQARVVRSRRTQTDEAGRMVPQRRTRRPAGVAPEGTVVAPEFAFDDAADAAPNWARRAVRGTAATATDYRRDKRATPGASVRGRGMLQALARADRPEDVIRVILERTEGKSSFATDLPSPVAHLVERIVRMQDEAAHSEEGATRPSRRTIETDEVFKPVFRGNTQDTENTANTFTTLSRRARGARTTDGVGASGAMKLASKLNKLIHLAEADRRKAHEHVRMAEGQAGARAGDAPDAAVRQRSEEPVNMQALYRDVFESVLREIESYLFRNQGDPDGWS